MSIKGVASAFAVVLLVVMTCVGAIVLKNHFGWSSATFSWIIFGVGTLAALILTYKIRYLAFIYAVPIAKDKPLKLAPLHYLGMLTMTIGAILSMANVSGVFITFQYADKMVLVLGLLIYMFTTPLNAQSIFKHSTKPNIPHTSKILMFTGSVILLFAIIGTFIDITLSTILPSDFGILTGFGCGSVLAIGMAILAEKTRKHIEVGNQPSRPSQKLLEIMWIRVSVMLALGFGLGVSTFTLGIPYVYTHFFGSPVTRIAIVSGWNYGSSRQCSKPEIEYRPFVIGEKALCTPKEAKLSMPIGTSLILEGRESVFGFNVEKVLLSKPAAFGSPDN